MYSGSSRSVCLKKSKTDFIYRDHSKNSSSESDKSYSSKDFDEGDQDRESFHGYDTNKESARKTE